MKDLIEMALDAGFLQKSASTFLCNIDCLKDFEALVRADERKQLALDKKAENARELGLDYESVLVQPTAQEMQNAAANLALMREMWGDPNQSAAKVNAEGFIVETGLLLSPGTLLYTTPPAAQPAPVQEHVARIAELEETVRQLNHALREATEAPTFMGEPVVAEPAQEPVAWISRYGSIHFEPWLDSAPLYTAPPAARREWVGLTDEQRDEICLGDEANAIAIEALLKRNNT